MAFVVLLDVLQGQYGYWCRVPVLILRYSWRETRLAGDVLVSPSTCKPTGLCPAHTIGSSNLLDVLTALLLVGDGSQPYLEVLVLPPGATWGAA